MKKVYRFPAEFLRSEEHFLMIKMIDRGSIIERNKFDFKNFRKKTKEKILRHSLAVLDYVQRGGTSLGRLFIFFRSISNRQ